MSVGDAFGKVFKWALDNGLLEKLPDLFRNQHRILVLGSSGVGKTNFLNSLRQSVPEVIDAVNRTETATKNKIEINTEPFIFIDTPGQVHHQSRRYSAIREEIGAGLSGVINVVSYGYHEYDGGEEKAINKNGTVNQSFLAKSRAMELKLLDEWTPLLGSKEVGKWLVTVANKADIWWTQKDEVLEFYRSGDYYKALGDAQSLSHIVNHNCSVFHKYYSVGELSGQFDDTDRDRARTALISTLLELVGRGEGQ